MSKSTLAFIGGTGKLGRALVGRFQRLGYSIIVGSRDESKHTNSPLSRVTDYKTAAQMADLIFLVTPYEAQAAAGLAIQDVVAGKIVVTAVVPLNKESPQTVQVPIKCSAAQELQQLLGAKTSVVAAFQNTAAHLLRSPELKVDVDVLICSDDAIASQKVESLATEIGVRGIVAGALANSLVVEGMTSILIAINKHYKVKTAGIRITDLPHLR